MLLIYFHQFINLFIFFLSTFLKDFKSDQDLKRIMKKIKELMSNEYNKINKTLSNCMQQRCEHTRTSLIVNNAIVEDMKEFTYTESRIIKERRSKKEIRVRIVWAIEALNKKYHFLLSNICQTTRKQLMEAYVWSIVIKKYETWTVGKKNRKRRQTSFEQRCYRRMLHISYRDRILNEEVVTLILQHLLLILFLFYISLTCPLIFL